ncbi:uncharacterized protein LOC144914153 isoform X1 [Branchiostoma floridae x Branchiostoma belcheri]
MADEGPTATLPALYIPPLTGPDEPAVGEAVVPAGDDVKLPFLSGLGGEALAEEVLRAPPEGDVAENTDLLSPDKLPPIPHPPIRPKREKMRYITFTAEATRHTKELKRTKRRRFSLEQKTEEEENAQKQKGPLGPEECLRCALRMEHAQCEPHKYIRVGGGFRHSYWYCKLIIQKMQEEAEDEVRMLLFDAESVDKDAPNIRVRADGTVERKIKTYVRTKSGRRIVKYHYVDDKTFQKLQQLREKGRKLGHGADFEGWEPWGEPTPEPSVKEFGESDIGSDKEIVIKDGKMYIRRKRRDSALGSDEDDDEMEVEVIEQIVGYTDDGKPIIKKIYRTVPKKKKGDDDRPDSGLSYSTKGRVIRRRTKSGRIVEEIVHGSGRGRRDKYYYDEKGRRIRRRSGSGGGYSGDSADGGRRGRGRRGRGRHDSAESGGSYYDKDGNRRIRHGSGRSEYSAGGTKVRSARRSRSRRRHGSGYSSDSRGGRRRRRGRKHHDADGNSYYSGGSRSGSRGGRRRRGRKHHDADGKSYYSSGSRSRSGSRGGRRRGRHGRRRGGRHGSGSYSRSGSEGSLDSQGRRKHRKGRRRHRGHGSGGSSRSGSRHGGRRRHRRHGSGDSASVVSTYSYDSQGNVTRKKHRRRRRSRSGSGGSGRGRHRRRGGGRRRRDSKGSYSSYSSYSDRGSGKGRRRRGRRRRSGSRGSRDSRGHRRRRHRRVDSQGNSYSEYSDYSSRSGSRGGGRRRGRRGKDGRSRRSRSRGGGRRRRRRGSGSSYSSSYYSSSSYESTEYDSEGRALPKKKKEKRDRRGRGRGHGRDRHGRRRRSVSSDSTSVSSDSATTVSSVLDLEDEDDPNITEEERQARRERNKAKIEAHEKKREERKVAREKRREDRRIRREEQKERREDRKERRRRRGSYSSSDESTWGDGKTAVKYGKGSRRDGKMRKDGRDIGYDDPNDPWNKGKKGRKGKDKKPRADGTYSSSSEETVYDEHGNKMPKKKKDKKKKKSGWFSSSSSETETEESIYEERIRADGTIEKVKVGTKKVKKKKDKKWKYRQKSADTEYDSVGSAEAEKMVFREVMDEFGNIIRLTKSGRRIKDGKISKEKYDWEGKAKRRRERIEAGLEPKPPSPEYEEEEIVEEYIDEEGNVVRTVRKVLKRKPGTGPPGREEEPLTGLRRVNQIFRKGGEQMLQRLKNLIAACELDDDMFLTDIDERDSSIDFLSHYHLIDRNKLEGYAKAFIVEDLDEDNILNLQETRIALEGIQSITNVSRKQTDYVLRVLGIDDSTHVTFRMFAVIAALCERMCTLDYKERYWMELTNLMDIERKMALYKAMFYCNVNSDRSANYIKADSLRIELIAGGLNRYQEEYIMSRIQINEYREVSFLDYMAYIPLFLSMHEKICDNPLDNSRNKYAMRVGSPVMRDQMPLGLPLRLAAASMKPFKVPQEILDEVEALSTLDTLKNAPNMVRLRALKMKQRGMTKSTSTTSLEKWNADTTHNMANNIATLIGGVNQ